ncbi:MAG: hypothetical protein HY046_08555 [Acidobacteria bacterium]|nr:hypothetical protein [Acidobacteriota bacterium]
MFIQAKEVTRKLVLGSPFLLLLALGISGQGSNVATGALDSYYNEAVQMVGNWNSQARVVLLLTILVGTFGAVTAFLQAIERPWRKIVTALVGLVIAVLTIVKQAGYPADHRTLEAFALEGQEVLDEMQTIKATYDPDQTAENLRALREEMLTRVKKIRAMQRSLLRTSGAAALPVAQAATQQPQWAQTQKGVPDPDLLTYAGTAKNRSLSEAKNEAILDAFRKAAADLHQKEGPLGQPQSNTVRLETLLDFVSDNGRLQRGTFSLEKSSGVYTYYALITLDRSFSKPDFLKTFAPPAKPRIQGEWILGGSTLSGSYRGTVIVKAARGNQGEFRFVLSARRVSSTSLTLKIDEIVVENDDSVGSTRWAFDLVVNGTVASSLPITRYDDSPSRKRVRPNLDPVTVSTPPAPRVPIQIYGYKPKDLESKATTKLS